MSTHVLRARVSRMLHASIVVTIASFVLACGDDAAPTATTGVGPAVALSITPPALSLVVGDGTSVTARVVDAANRTVAASVSWSSADPTVATVRDVDGYVVAVSPGSTIVTARAGALAASAKVSVRPPDPPVSVSITPNAVSVIVGGVERLVARAVDSTGRGANVSFEWTSADPAVATVGKTDGMVTAVAPGTTTVTVSTGAVSGTATISVIDFAGSFAFTRTSSSGGRFASDVLIYSSAEKSLRPLPRSPDFASISGAAWSPNGAQFAVERVNSFFGPPEYEWLEYTSDLYIVDAATTGTSAWRALTTNGMSKSPSWSPDGRRIAYVEQDILFSSNHISLIDAAGGVSVRLTRGNGYYGRPIWSPDGTRVAFSAWEAGSEQSQIFIADVDGSKSTRFTPVFTSDYDPSWSPDGTRLAFIRLREQPASVYHFDVVVANVDGTDVRRLTSSSEFASAPSWSPDGRQIMFALGNGLSVMNADGSALTRVTMPTGGAYDGAPTWR